MDVLPDSANVLGGHIDIDPCVFVAVEHVSGLTDRARVPLPNPVDDLLDIGLNGSRSLSGYFAH